MSDQVVPENILDEAARLVSVDRQQEYGDPLESFNHIALMWSGIIGVSVSPEQVGLCMIALKLRREGHRHKRDNLVDIIGYAQLLQLIAEQKEGNS